MSEPIRIKLDLSVETTLVQLEKIWLERTLELVPQKKRLAEVLGISRSALYAKLSRHGLFNDLTEHPPAASSSGSSLPPSLPAGEPPTPPEGASS